MESPAERINRFIHENIPIVERNNFALVETDGYTATIRGKYSDHVNHHNSVFGGSIASAATLAAWSLLQSIMESVVESLIEEPNSNERANDFVVVVRRQSVEFYKPVVRDFEAITRPLDEGERRKLAAMYRKFGTARVRVQVDVRHVGETEVLAELSGDFVVMRGDGSARPG